MFYLTTNDANQILPEVIKKFEIALKKKNEVSKLEQKLQVLLETSNKFDEYIPLKQKLNSAITQFFESLEILLDSVDLAHLLTVAEFVDVLGDDGVSGRNSSANTNFAGIVEGNIHDTLPAIILSSGILHD